MSVVEDDSLGNNSGGFYISAWPTTRAQSRNTSCTERGWHVCLNSSSWTPTDSANGKELDDLGSLVEAYEEKHFPF